MEMRADNNDKNQLDWNTLGKESGLFFLIYFLFICIHCFNSSLIYCDVVWSTLVNNMDQLVNKLLVNK